MDQLTNIYVGAMAVFLIFVVAKGVLRTVRKAQGLDPDPVKPQKKASGSTSSKKRKK